MIRVGKNPDFKVVRRTVNGSAEYFVFYKNEFFTKKFRNRDVETYLN